VDLTGDGQTSVALDSARIAEAARTIDPVFINSPQFVDEQLCAALGRHVLVKIETVNPIGSFKGRGADVLVRRIARDGVPGRAVVCASSGNFGQAVAYVGRAQGIGVRVFVAPDVNVAKRARMELFGATVIVVDGDDVAVEAAMSDHMAAHPTDVLIVGDEPEIAEGAGTIGIELLAAGQMDTVVVPVGSGALITGVARWIKESAPGTRVVGVCPQGAPAMANSFRAGRPVRGTVHTIAEGIATATPAPDIVRRMRALVDDVVLVSDAEILAATTLVARTLGLLIEPSGAAGLAAIAGRELPGQRFATVLTGAGPKPEILPRILGSNEAKLAL
jgi:threonine dehydratase